MFLHVGTLFGLRGPEAGCDLNLHAIGDGMSVFKIERKFCRPHLSPIIIC